MGKSAPLRERFYEKVDKHGPLIISTRCWAWTASLINEGYGRLWNKDKMQSAHRISYLLHKGEPPAGKQILHQCDNRKCINPEHLFAGTQKENMQDMIKKGRKRTRGMGTVMPNPDKPRKRYSKYLSGLHFHSE